MQLAYNGIDDNDDEDDNDDDDDTLTLLLEDFSVDLTMS